jgi:hypothetical protein
MANDMNDLKSILSSKKFDVSENSFGGNLTQSDMCCSWFTWNVFFGCWVYTPCWNAQPIPCNTSV